MSVVIECSGCGKQQSGRFLQLNGDVCILYFERSFGVKYAHQERVEVCGECYEALCDILHLRGGKR